MNVNTLSSHPSCMSSALPVLGRLHCLLQLWHVLTATARGSIQRWSLRGWGSAGQRVAHSRCKGRMEKHMSFLLLPTVYSLYCWFKGPIPCVESGFGSARCVGCCSPCTGATVPHFFPLWLCVCLPSTPRANIKVSLASTVAPGMSDFRPFQHTRPPFLL